LCQYLQKLSFVQHINKKEQDRGWPWKTLQRAGMPLLSMLKAFDALLESKVSVCAHTHAHPAPCVRAHTG
jgi:hypothetical protein